MKNKVDRILSKLGIGALAVLIVGAAVLCTACRQESDFQDTKPSAEEQETSGLIDTVFYSQEDAREFFDIPDYLQKTACVGEKVSVARVVPSEEKAQTFRSFVVFGEVVVETERGVFRPAEAGTYQCMYEYTLDQVKHCFSYSVEVSVKDGPVFINEPSVPVAFIEGKNYQISAMQAYDYARQQAVQVTVSASCGDQPVAIGENGAVRLENCTAGELTIVWQAGSGNQTVEMKKTVPVINIGSGNAIRYGELFVGTGWNVKSYGEEGVHLVTTDSATATFANPLIANSTEMRFGFGQQDCAERVVLTMTSCEEPSVTVSVAFQKGRQSEGKGKIVLNGTEEKTYQFTQGQMLSVRYNAVSGKLIDGEGNLLFQPEYDVNGNAFSGFPGGLVYVSWSVENVYGQCDLKIEKLGAQTFTGNTRDLLAPALSFESFGSQYQIGEEIVISDIHAVDMVDPNAEITIHLYQGMGEDAVEVEGTLENGMFRYTPTVPDKYLIQFKATDHDDNSATLVRYLCVYDSSAPQLVVGKEPDSTAVVNSVVMLPAVSAADEDIADISLFVIYPSGQMRLLQSSEAIDAQNFKLDRIGTYRFRIVATDTSGNETLKDIVVNVTENEEGKG